jgi:hypothetical protein
MKCIVTWAGASIVFSIAGAAAFIASIRSGDSKPFPIVIGDSNTFSMIAIPTHLWYQVINAGASALEYFMIHEPAFDASELLMLRSEDCPPEWAFEY